MQIKNKSNKGVIYCNNNWENFFQWCCSFYLSEYGFIKGLENLEFQSEILKIIVGFGEG